MADGVVDLLDGVTDTSSGFPVRVYKFPANVQVVLSGDTPTAVVVIEGCNQQTPVNWFPILTFTLSGDGETAGRSFGAEWRWIRARVSSISGTGASVSAYLSGRGR